MDITDQLGIPAPAAQENILEDTTKMLNLDGSADLPTMTGEEARTRESRAVISKETDPNFRSVGELAKEELEKKFRNEDGIFYFRDRNGQPAFKDTGNKISTSHNDARVAEATVLLAQSKGWESIKVSGHPDFKREVWFQANLKGMKVDGYKPTEKDLAALESELDKSLNKIFPGEARANGSLPLDAEADYSKSPDSKAERIYKGLVIEHGAAPYQNDKKNNPNYYLTIQNDKGEKETVWGVDLGRAVNESGVKTGEMATIRYLGNKPVNVMVQDKDKQGAVIGERQIMTNRNTWSVEKDAVAREIAKQVMKGKNVDQNTIKKIDKAIQAKQEKIKQDGGKTPAVRIFDINSPKPSKQRTQDIVRERQRERVLDKSR